MKNKKKMNRVNRQLFPAVKPPPPSSSRSFFRSNKKNNNSGSNKYQRLYLVFGVGFLSMLVSVGVLLAFGLDLRSMLRDYDAAHVDNDDDPSRPSLISKPIPNPSLQRRQQQQQHQNQQRRRQDTAVNDGYSTNLSFVSLMKQQRHYNATVVSLSVPMPDHGEKSELNHFLYTSLHRYQYISQHRDHTYHFFNSSSKNNSNNKNESILQHEFDTSQFKGFYHKPMLLKHVMDSRYSMMMNNSNKNDNSSLVLWVDSDVLFMDCRMTAEKVYDKVSHLSAQHLKLLTTNKPDIVIGGGQFNAINSGVILMRNSKFSRRFLNEWVRLTELYAVSSDSQSKLTSFHDQSTLILVLSGLTYHQIQHDIQQQQQESSDVSSFNQREYLRRIAKEREGPFEVAHGKSWDNCRHTHDSLLDSRLAKRIAVVPMGVLSSFYEFGKRPNFAGMMAFHLAGKQQDKADRVRRYFDESNCATLFYQSHNPLTFPDL